MQTPSVVEVEFVKVVTFDLGAVFLALAIAAAVMTAAIFVRMRKAPRPE